MRLFVYGTLKKGYWNNRYLGTSELVGTTRVTGYKLVDLGGIPAMIYTDNPLDKVVGEEWEVDQDTLTRTDTLEGHPVWYKRQVLRHDFWKGHDLQGYVYQSREGPMPDCERNSNLEYEWEGDR